MELNVEAGYAVVEPGVVLDDLNAAGCPTRSARGARPIDPQPLHASAGWSATTPVAAHSVIWGTTAQNVLGLDVIRSDGTRVRLTSPGAPAAAGRSRLARAGWSPGLRAARLHGQQRGAHPPRAAVVATARLRLRARLAAARPRPRPRQGHGGHGGHLRRPRASGRTPGAPAGRHERCWCSASRTTSRVPEPCPACSPQSRSRVESLSAELLALAHARAEDVGLPEGGAWLMVEARADDATGSS